MEGIAGCSELLTLKAPLRAITSAMLRDVYHNPPETPHYTVMFKSGGVRKRVTERSLRGLRASEVDWLWAVEQKRRATPEELLKVCKGVSKR